MIVENGYINLELMPREELESIDWGMFFYNDWIEYSELKNRKYIKTKFSITFLKENIDIFIKHQSLGWMCDLTDEIAQILLDNKIDCTCLTREIGNLNTTQLKAFNSYNPNWVSEDWFGRDLSSIKLSQESIHTINNYWE